ncbi:MAG: GTPase Era [Nitrospirae bacterium]|nr:GTPase Era [Nitrospirota bacterium]
MEEPDNNKFKSGFVSIVGLPNVGKSTLLNILIGEKVSIVSPRPQTTRNRTLGVKNLPDTQIVFIDTPGIYKPDNMLGKYIVSEALKGLSNVDIIYFVVTAVSSIEEHREIISLLLKAKCKIILVINKIDIVQKQMLLPIIEQYSNALNLTAIVPVSALKGEGIEQLIEVTVEHLVYGPRYYPDDIYTDQLERAMCQEIIREKVIKYTYEEIPQSIAVEIISWKEKNRSEISGRNKTLILIEADIYVEKDSQKGIIIGKDGSRLKAAGRDARIELENLLDAKVFFKPFVRVRKNWRRDERALRDMGFK